MSETTKPFSLQTEYQKYINCPTTDKSGQSFFYAGCLAVFQQLSDIKDQENVSLDTKAAQMTALADEVADYAMGQVGQMMEKEGISCH